VCEVLRTTAVLLFPFVPGKAQEIWRALGIEAEIEKGDFEGALAWRDSWEGIAANIGELRSLFPRIDVSQAGIEETAGGAAQKEEGRMKPEGTGAPEPTGVVDISEFRKMDLRIAHVKSATTVEGASKLLKLAIDIGGEERQIVAGIAQHYTPEELTGKNIVVIVNLKPARIRGIDSNGMLLATTDAGKVIVLVPDKPAAPGSKIS